ncbi:MAG TPA: NEW3 domain-containing protein [Devosiaceae bacterium]
MCGKSSVLATLVLGAAVLAVPAVPAFAQSTGADCGAPGASTGIWMTTAYPDVTETAGNPFTIDMTVKNDCMPPKRLDLALDGLPKGWAYEFDGGGKPVSAVMVGPGESRSITVKVTPAKDAAFQDYPITVTGTGSGESLSLPLKVALAAPSPADLKLDAKLPDLRGSAKSKFDYELTIRNDSPADEVVNLAAAAPPGFDTTFTEQYGSQELTSIPVKANQSTTVKLSVQPPQDVEAGTYQVAVEAASSKITADTKLVLDVTGQPRLALNGPEGRLSGSAVAGQERSFKFTVKNDGSAPAQAVKVSASAPSGWKVDFNPASLDALAPGDQQDVEMRITPANNAIAGDYMVNVSSNAQGASDNAAFRVTVNTSTAWGFAGIAVIAAALLVLVGAVLRYGRR